MITQPGEAQHLGDFAELYRLLVELLRLLANEGTAAVTIPEQLVAAKLVRIVQMAARQDRDLSAAVEQISPLHPDVRGPYFSI